MRLIIHTLSFRMTPFFRDLYLSCNAIFSNPILLFLLRRPPLFSVLWRLGQGCFWGLPRNRPVPTLSLPGDADGACLFPFSVGHDSAYAKPFSPSLEYCLLFSNVCPSQDLFFLLRMSARLFGFPLALFVCAMARLPLPMALPLFPKLRRTICRLAFGKMIVSLAFPAGTSFRPPLALQPTSLLFCDVDLAHQKRPQCSATVGPRGRFFSF